MHIMTYVGDEKFSYYKISGVKLLDSLFCALAYDKEIYCYFALKKIMESISFLHEVVMPYIVTAAGRQPWNFLVNKISRKLRR